MELALQQAHINIGNTNENPSVGCVITKNNNIISAGHTSLHGRPHAEYNAIKNSKINLKNSEIYITLEPCSHFGKTPPCTNLIIKKKIKRVFFSIKDPDKRSFNKSYKNLTKKKIFVKSGFIIKKVNTFYQSYIKFKKNNLPFVTLKIATSKDYFTKNKKTKWITNVFSRGRVHLIRAKHDCIITSSKTVIDDNPHFTCRINGLSNKSPARFILDKNLITPLTSNIYKDTSKHKTVVFYNNFNVKKIKNFKKKKIILIKVKTDKFGKLNLKEILSLIKKLGYSRILVEAGASLSESFLKYGFVDSLNLFISNKKLNTLGRNNIKKCLTLTTKNKKKCIEKVNLFGDKLITYNMQ